MFVFFNVLGQQKAVFEGTVQDSLGKPLELANVMLYNKLGTIALSYTTSNAAGKYKLQINPDSSYLLKVSLMGYFPYSERILKGTTLPKNIVLASNVSNLDEVKITMPIKISGDTISYNTGSFTNGNERKLVDVFKKLPGFEVDGEGQVMVKGKKVDKITVNGQDFFSGDTKIASQNIPANVIDKINLINSQGDFSPRLGFGENEALTIDVGLKKGKKNIVFGNADLGFGPKSRYLAHTNMSVFNQKASFNLIADANNIGQPILTLKDYFKFNGGFTGPTGQSSFRLSSDALGFATLVQNKSAGAEAGLAGLNFSVAPSKTIKLSGFYIHSAVNYEIISRNVKTYISNQADNVEVLTAEINQKNRADIAKINAVATLGKFTNIEYNLLMNSNGLREGGLNNSSFSATERKLGTQRDKKPFSVNQDLKAYYSKDSKNIFNVTLSQRHQKQENLFGLSSSEPIPFGDLGLNQNDYFQNKSINTNIFSAALKYYYLINKKRQLDFVAGFESNRQEYVSGISLGSADSVLADPRYNNQLRYHLTDSYAGVGFKALINKLTINPAIYVHGYRLSAFSPSDNDYTELLVQPSLKIKYEIKKASILTLNYNLGTEFLDVQYYAQAYTIESYNALFKGNTNLFNPVIHRVNLDYYNFDTYHYSYLYALISYQRKYNEVNNILAYNDFTSVMSPFNLRNPNEITTAYITNDRRFPFFKTKFSATLSYLRFKNILSESIIQNSSFMQNYKVSIESTLKDLPVVEVGFETNINHYFSAAFNRQLHVINQPFANVEVTILKEFILTSDFRYYFQNGTDQNQAMKYAFWNSSLYYKRKNSRLELKASVLNLLNTKNITANSFTENYTAVSDFIIQPRYFTLSLNYRL
ncbi:carboxypeptidase-like regulatory domain-containing protein [Pedobacter zeae]|uniref:Outer membrane receptor proteins, mostly Fe transport n=1 Tax=Pedobacter zeae TaxID=1737356 RepID=A0A7W6P5A2_9SPHI|nr:carboxypeptidase-like regulatory domain-containing protein [Pedobacter zeae]MBB4106746.1 hypothetical protein [Pedobacter zeae]